MLGMEDPMITIAWLGTLLSMVGCVVFGIVMWNRGEEE
ncbi:symporter small accessory protein [Bacillus sp. REN10]